MSKIGVIDIGTNTVRAVGYSKNDLSVVLENVYESQILKNTDENENLCFLGMNSLKETIKKQLEFFAKNEIYEIYAFATSAMRDIKNFKEVYEFIKTETKIEIDLLTEEDEAKCDYFALKNSLFDNSKGVGIDLGGGSLQIVTFNSEGVNYFNSFPIGVKRLYNKFGKYESLNENKILEYIKEIINDVPKCVYNTLFVMGGTGKIIAKILNTDRIDVSLLDNNEFPFCNEENYKGHIKMSINPVPYGVLVISEIAKNFSAENIKILNGSSRDGYIISKL